MRLRYFSVDDDAQVRRISQRHIEGALARLRAGAIRVRRRRRTRAYRSAASAMNRRMFRWVSLSNSWRNVAGEQNTNLSPSSV